MLYYADIPRQSKAANVIGQANCKVRFADRGEVGIVGVIDHSGTVVEGSRALAGLRLEEFRQAFIRWLQRALADQEGRWIDGKTCCQGRDADGSPVQMLNVFLQKVKVTLDQWSVGGDKTNEPGSLKRRLSDFTRNADFAVLLVFAGRALGP